MGKKVVIETTIVYVAGELSSGDNPEVRSGVECIQQTSLILKQDTVCPCDFYISEPQFPFSGQLI